MKEYNVRVYKIAGEAIVTIEAESADVATGIALDKVRELKFEESTRRYEAEAIASNYAVETIIGPRQEKK